jgi:hypothetical protein
VPDSATSTRQSLNLGIFVLMGVTGGVLAGFLRFIISIVRLSKADLKVRLYDNRGRSTGVEAGLPRRSLGAPRRASTRSSSSTG